MRCSYLGPPIQSIATENGPTCDIANPMKWNGLRIDPQGCFARDCYYALVIKFITTKRGGTQPVGG